MDFVRQYLDEVAQVARRLDPDAIGRIIDVLATVREAGGRLFILGVGGSAGNASHAVNDFRKIAGIEAYAPTDNVSELTARINDDGWESSFANWLRGSRLREGDCVLVFSVGGGDAERGVSVNLVRAVEYAKSAGARVCGIVGRSGGFTAKMADACVSVRTIKPATANLTMAVNVARYVEAHPVGRCVYLGSDAVYGFDLNPVTETTPVAPGGYYALAKYTGEKTLECVATAKGLPLLSLRVTGVYGPGDPHGAYGPNAFARSLARDRTVRLFGEGEEERDHIYVDDVARLASALLRSGATGLFNLASGESRSFAEIIQTIRGIVPYEFTVTRTPRKGSITHRRFDTARLQRALPGFGFTSFKDGLRATLAAFGAL